MREASRTVRSHPRTDLRRLASLRRSPIPNSPPVDSIISVAARYSGLMLWLNLAKFVAYQV